MYPVSIWLVRIKSVLWSVHLRGGIIKRLYTKTTRAQAHVTTDTAVGTSPAAVFRSSSSDMRVRHCVCLSHQPSLWGLALHHSSCAEHVPSATASCGRAAVTHVPHVWAARGRALWNSVSDVTVFRAASVGKLPSGRAEWRC